MTAVAKPKVETKPTFDADAILNGVLTTHGRPQGYCKGVVKQVGPCSFRVNLYSEEDRGFMKQLVISASYFIVQTANGELVTK